MRTKHYEFTGTEILALRNALIEASIISKKLLKHGVHSPISQKMHQDTIALAEQFKQDALLIKD